jgi:hypothetical protein
MSPLLEDDDGEVVAVVEGSEVGIDVVDNAAEAGDTEDDDAPDLT